MDLTPAEIEILTTWAEYVEGEWGFGNWGDHNPQPEHDLYARLKEPTETPASLSRSRVRGD